MVFDHRKFTSEHACEIQCKLRKEDDRQRLKAECIAYCTAPPSPPSPPLAPPPAIRPIKTYNPIDVDTKHTVQTSLIVTSSMIGGAFFLFLVYMVLKRYFTRRNSLRTRNLPIIFHTHDDFFDEDRVHGPMIDHHVWFINTVGLPRSIIDSITVCKYKTEEGLIEGTECSVCLSEFEEDENLRLLPKCSHAFHLPCIDTWLRSHKNCPLCRAPIVSDIAAAVAQASVSEQRMNVSDPSQGTQIENLDSNSGLASNNGIGGETGEIRVEEDEEQEEGDDNNGGVHYSESGSNCIENPVKGFSDSVFENSNSSTVEIQEPMRRSVSVDSSSAIMIYRDVASFVSDQGTSTSLGMRNLNNPKRSRSGSLSLYKLVNSSIGLCSLQKGPVSMKRSSSYARKFNPSKHFRSHSSIIPR